MPAEAARAPSATLIRLERVSKYYEEGSRARAVLRETSAEIATGEFVAVRGRSGCGKSTLLNLLAGLDLPTGGEVFVGGVCVSRLAARERTAFRLGRLGFVFQFFNLIPTLSAFENVRLPAELAGLRSGEADARAAALLEQVGLGGSAGCFPDTLSGGEQQRVAIARALILRPELILADEPTGNLDDRTGLKAMDLLEELVRREGRTLVVVTHSREVAARADRLLGIEHGRLVEGRRRD